MAQTCWAAAVYSLGKGLVSGLYLNFTVCTSIILGPRWIALPGMGRTKTALRQLRCQARGQYHKCP
eukprot:scaffold3874_cov18-Tisochrysis_lutea.AAC.2